MNKWLGVDVLPEEGEKVLLDTGRDFLIGSYDFILNEWSDAPKVIRWCRLERNWLPFANNFDLSEYSYILVWDTRHSKPKIVQCKDGLLIEENGRQYALSHNMFYSHWSPILCDVPASEVETWVKEHGVRIGTDK